MGSLKTSAGTNFAGKEASSYWAMPFTRKRPMASPHLHFLLLLLSLVECASASDILLVTDQNSHEAIKRTPLAHLFADNHFETNENDAATFRVLTTNTHRWDELDFGDGVSLQVQRSNHSFNLTTMLLQTYDYQMHPADAGFLYDIVRHSNAGVALLQIGEKDTTEFNKVVRSAANCTHRGKLLIDIPHTIYFCNHIEVSNIPFYDSTAVEELSAGHRSTQSASGFFVSAIPSAPHNSNEKLRNAHLHIHILKHRKKRVNRIKLAQISLRRKHSIMMARHKYIPNNLERLPMSKRRILCKYRKSCYLTGGMPFYAMQTTQTEQMGSDQIEIPDKQLGELEIKVLCKYRKSCYDQIGARHTEKKPVKAHRVLTSKSVHIISKPRKRRTLKEIAEIALKHVDEQEKRGAQRPKPKMIIVKAKLNQIEEKRAEQLRCKYRKSCYETGVRPILDGGNYLFQAFHFLTKHVDTPGEETLKNVTTNITTEQKKLFCKYRRSCYETGEKPEIDHKEKFKYQHVMVKHEAEIPLQIKCHYRKSCYETGKVPDLRWSNSNKTEEQPSKDAPRTVTQLKLSCKYRKSCYLQHVLEQAQLEDAAISHKQVERVQDREFEPTRPFQPAASIETKKEIPELSVEDEAEQKPPKIIPTTTDAEIHEAKQKEVSAKRRIGAKKKSKQQPQPSLHEAETTPAHERASKKYEILSSDNETVPWHVRKRHLKHRIEQVALQRKHARLLAKRENTIISQLSQSGRKLLCKYRKSCYETGVLPMFLQKEQEKSEEMKALSEAELKVFCKYRKSCYDEIGTKYDRQIPGKDRLVLAGKGTPTAQKQRKKRSVKEMAEIALRRAHQKQERAAEKPRPKMAIIKAQLNKIEANMQRKLACKYRKSCYERGIRPVIECDNSLMRIYSFLSEHLHIPSKETVFNATFADLESAHKRLFCKYRKSCYETGVKPNIEHEERFNYKHIIEKRDVEIPLEIKCHYRKSCYETGIVPDLRAVETITLAQQPSRKAPGTIAELKLHCRYRKSCYLNKTAEQPDLLTGQQPPQEEKRQVVLLPIKLADELKTKILPAIVKVQKVDEEKSRETKTAREDSIVKETVEPAAILEETTKPSKTWAKPTTESIAKATEERTKKQRPTTKNKKTPIEMKPTTKDKEKATDATGTTEAIKETTEKKLSEKKEKVTKAYITNVQPASAPKKDEEKIIDKREQKKEKQKRASVTLEKPVIMKAVKKDKPSESTTKTKDAPKTKPTQPKAEKDMKKEKEVKEEIPKMDVEKPTEMKEKPRMVPHKEIRFIPPPTPPAPEEEIPPFKTVHIDGDVETLEEKLRCKYRKSCYHNRTLPHPFEGFKIEHITKREEQHIPMQYRCKYRKSCYETGEIPHTADNFKVEHLVVKKEEYIPLPLRCKYRKSCYESGVVPNIDQEFFIIASFQKFMREFYEETEEIRREMSEEERKLSCKYRKSCYETGKLPQIEQETIKTIADTMKETTLSLHLRCKYRKSCYANYGIPAIKDTKRMPKPEAVIEKPSTSTVGEQAKVRTTEDQRKPHPPTTVDESDKKKTTKKSKKSEKKQDIEEELPYMQRALSEEKRPTTLALAQKLKCKYRIKCYEGVPMHKVLHEIKKETIPIKNFQRADGRPCTIYHLSCRRMAGLPIKQRAPIGPNGRRLCRKKPKAEAAAK
uniref:Titin n=1 Tax=Parascaris univalens TaxID=6257 RepID=A0A915AL59_PARUN